MATRKYTLGKGKILFKPDVAGVEGKSYIDFGNAPEFGMNLTTEKAEHFSSRSGLQLKDMSIVKSVACKATFTLDEPNADNLKLFVLSNLKATYNQSLQGSLSSSLKGEGASAAGKLQATALGTWIPLYHATTSDAALPTPAVAVPAVTNSGQYDTGTHVISDAGTMDATDVGFYEVMIIATGTPDQAVWRVNGGAWSAAANCSTNADFDIAGGAIHMDWTENTGHTLGATWSFTIVGINTDGKRLVKIQNTPLTPSSDFELKDSTGTITYVEGADGVGNYQLDREAGLLYLNPDQSGAADAITDGQFANEFNVRACWEACSEPTHLDAFTLTSLKGHIMFVGAPPQGQAIDVQGYCSIMPTGDLALIGDDWMKFQFEVEFLEHTRYKDANNTQGLMRVTNRAQVG